MGGDHSPSAGTPPHQRLPGSLAPWDPRAVPAGNCAESRPRSAEERTLSPHALGPQSALPLPLHAPGAPEPLGVIRRDLCTPWRPGGGWVWRCAASAGGGTRQAAAYLRASPPHLRALGCPLASTETPAGPAGRSRRRCRRVPPSPRLSALPCSPARSLPPAPACSPRPPGSVLSQPELAVGWRRPRGHFLHRAKAGVGGSPQDPNFRRRRACRKNQIGRAHV